MHILVYNVLVQLISIPIFFLPSLFLFFITCKAKDELTKGLSFAFGIIGIIITFAISLVFISNTLPKALIHLGYVIQ